MPIDEITQELNKVVNEKNIQRRAVMSRTLLEKAIYHIYDIQNEKVPNKASLLELIDGPVVSLFIGDQELLQSLHYIRILGLNAQHGKKIRKSEIKLAVQNLSQFIGFIKAKEQGNLPTIKMPYMSEFETRKLYVDLYLEEAGWEILDKENVVMPSKAGIEIEVQGMPNNKGVGYCDYVLYGKDAKPLAIVEVKKTSVSPEKGRHQVDLYGDCMKAAYGYKPVLYYTNGYTINVIDGIYPDRKVMAFHTCEELELMLKQRNRGDITDLEIQDYITDRPYQKMAVTNICEWLNKKHRRGLLVMATGTGKTRVAISIVDVLIRNNWIKNVLFLADRTTLVDQAKKNFAKLLPSQTVCELSGKDEKDYNARLMFCTYQTMINYIDAEDKRFKSGRFDLIIIDEAHRSIFNRYGTIFKYFDSLLIGLTATPKDEVDANTYSIFGCESGTPNFDYSMEEGIKDKYLVGYQVISRTSELIENGIKYNKLSKDEQKQLDEFFGNTVPTPDYTIPGGVLFKILYNFDTCRLVLEDLMKYGLKVDQGETIGKTIIFAYNHKHAQMIVDCFHKIFPEYPANYCQLVDNYVNYAQDLVDKFEENPEFRIAVSVDMLDTGVDVPPVVNLVFFKKIHSKIKFIQMIGRGTRLCENLYGPGKDKDKFLIFDYLDNFKYFHEHPNELAPKETLSLSQRSFQSKVDILYLLQKAEYQMDALLQDYYKELKNNLIIIVKGFKAHSTRIQVREEMQFVDKYCDVNNWMALSEVSVTEIKRHLSPLLEGGLEGDPLAVAFDCRIYTIEKSLLKIKSINNAVSDIKTVRKIADFLLEKKASVPQVLDKAVDLKRIESDDFWDDPTVIELEKLRKSLRGLMQFLKGEGEKKIDVNIKDKINDSDYVEPDTNIDIRTYRQRILDYLADNSDNSTIVKIYNLEPINNDDLKELEHILWSDLGTKDDYQKETNQQNLAAFVRSLIGLNQEAVNKKFGEYLNGNKFNAQQQEFVKMVIDYTRENGDVSLSDIVNSEPFSNYNVTDIFGTNIPALAGIISTLHNSVVCSTQ